MLIKMSLLISTEACRNAISGWYSGELYHASRAALSALREIAATMFGDQRPDLSAIFLELGGLSNLVLDYEID